MAIDTHAHVFKRGLKLAPVVRYVPSYDAPVTTYLEAMDANEIGMGVIIQPSFLGTDNTYMVDCLAGSKGRLRGVAVVEPTVSIDELARLNDLGVVGVRLNLIGKELPPLHEPEWRTHLDTLARLGWQVEVQCAAREHVVVAPQLLSSGVNVVVDHFGLPSPDLGVKDPSLDRLLGFGATRRLWVKLSAPYRLGPDGDRHAAEIYPELKRRIGLDRLIWGSDWPNTQFETSQDYRKNRAFLDNLSATPLERAQILDNARDLFRF